MGLTKRNDVLDRLVPYVVELMSDEASIVRVAAVRTLVQVVCTLSFISFPSIPFHPFLFLPSLSEPLANALPPHSSP